MRARAARTLLAALLCCQSALAQVTLTEGTDISVDVAPDGRIVMDLVGGIWVLPLEGGSAQPLDAGMLPAERPRWSPDGEHLAFQMFVEDEPASLAAPPAKPEGANWAAPVKVIEKYPSHVEVILTPYTADTKVVTDESGAITFLRRDIMQLSGKGAISCGIRPDLNSVHSIRFDAETEA